MKNSELDLSKIEDHLYINSSTSLTGHDPGDYIRYKYEKNISFDTDWRDVVNLLYSIRQKYIAPHVYVQLRLYLDEVKRYYMYSLDYNFDGEKYPENNSLVHQRSLILDTDDTRFQARSARGLQSTLVRKPILHIGPFDKILIYPLPGKN